MPKGGSDGPTASSASKPPRPKNQVEVKSHITVEYGCWSCKGEDINVGKPIALILFSGRSRPGDLHNQLVNLGWIVCSVDMAAPIKTNLLDDGIWEKILADIRLGMYEAVWVATPCGSLSPLRENQPGPRPLRTVEKIQGKPKEELTQGEQRQLREANVLVSRSATAGITQVEADRIFGLENPDHGPDRPSLWLMPSIKKLEACAGMKSVHFDQCRTGLETTKPTKIILHKAELEQLDGLRCNHPKRTFEKPDGSKYEASHQSAVQRWVVGPDGKRERASRSQGEYTAELSEAIAKAFHRAWQAGELKRDPLP